MAELEKRKLPQALKTPPAKKNKHACRQIGRVKISDGLVQLGGALLTLGTLVLVDCFDATEPYWASVLETGIYVSSRCAFVGGAMILFVGCAAVYCQV
jgi:hypothetical protein